MAEPITILELMASLASSWFKGESWNAWKALLAALFALPMTDEQTATYRRHTARQQAPVRQATEAWLEVGRRGGKSIIAALVALHAAVFRSYAGILAPGERGLVMVVAADRRQARVVFQYITAFFDRSPGLSALVERRTQDAVHLKNGISIEVHTASFRAVRGYTIVCFIADEISVWRDESSANPDVEILNAVRPAQATVPRAIRLCISSPYARRGALWEAHNRHFGREGDPVLVWAADTLSMNPLVPPEVIEEAFLEDEAVAWAEYGRDGMIQFRRDIEGYVSREVLQGCVVSGRVVLPPVAGVAYQAFVDPSGGSSDAMTLAIAHENAGRGILDCVLERKPPFSPEEVVQEFAAVLRRYGLAHVVGDRYGGEWPRERFSVHGVSYAVSEKTKSDLYRELLPLLNSGQVELLDVSRLVAQLGGLERRTARGGKDSIDHGPGGHDDLINSAAGALVSCAQARNIGLWFMRSDSQRVVRVLGPEPVAEVAEMIAARAAKREADELETQRILEERDRREIWSRSEAWTNW